MTVAMFYSPTVRGFTAALLSVPSACANIAKPEAYSVGTMSPVGTITMTEIISIGATGAPALERGMDDDCM